MEIVYKNKKKVAFEKIAIGEVFSWDGALYIATQESTSTSTGEIFNAVNLADGESTYFEDSDEVLLVKAQLVIS